MSFLTARKNAGLTQKEVADQIGVDQTAVSFWENGKTLPRASLLSKIAMIYGVTVDELLSDRGEGGGEVRGLESKKKSAEQAALGDDLDRKIRRFDRRTIEILVSALVSLLTSTFVLSCAGII